MAIQRPISSDRKFKNAVAKRNEQAANLAALKEQQRKTAESKARLIALEQEDQTAIDNANAAIAMESFAEKAAPELVKARAIDTLGKFKNTGKEKLWNKAIFEIVYESLWVDDDVKASEVRPMFETFCDTVSFIKSVVPDSFSRGRTPIKTKLDAAINDTVQHAYDRTEVLFEAACDQGTINDKVCDRLKFNLSDDEEADFDKKLDDLGKSEIVNLVKKKVIHVIQDEQKAADKKASIFQDLDDAATPDDESNDDTTDATAPAPDDSTEANGEEPASDAADNSDSDEEMTESTVLLSFEDGHVYTYGDFLSLMEAAADLSKTAKNKNQPVMELGRNDDPKINAVAKRLLNLCKISDAEATNPKVVKKKIRDIMADPNSSDNKKYSIAILLLSILGAMSAMTVGAIVGPLGFTVGYIVAVIIVYVGAMTDGGQVAKVKNIKKQLLEIRRSTTDKKKIEEIDKGIEACDDAIMRLTGTLYQVHQESMNVKNPFTHATSPKKEETKPTFEQLVYQKRLNEANRIGISSVFEGLMIFNRESAIRELAHENNMNGGTAVVESMIPEFVTEAAMMQTLVQYTTLETLNTMKYIDFTKSEADSIMEALTKIDASLAKTENDTNSEQLTLTGQWKTLPDSRKVSGRFGPRLM